MKQLLGLLVFIITFYSAKAQEALPISKDEVILKVRENNATLKMAEQDVLAAKGEFNQAYAVILPNNYVSHTGIATTNPLMATGSKLNQEIITQADFTPSLLNDPYKIEDYAT